MFQFDLKSHWKNAIIITLALVLSVTLIAAIIVAAANALLLALMCGYIINRATESMNNAVEAFVQTRTIATQTEHNQWANVANEFMDGGYLSC